MTTGKPPLALWIVSERKRLKWKLEELAARLRAAGFAAADTTVRTWEAGRRPSPETIAAMERLFDSAAPAEEAGYTDIDSLVSAIAELTRVIDEERQARVEWERGFLEALRDLAGAPREAKPSGGPAPRIRGAVPR